MNVYSLTTVRDRIEEQVANLQEEIDDLQDEVKPKKDAVNVLTCLITITESIDQVSTLEPSSGVIRCRENLEAAQSDLCKMYEALYGVEL